MANSKLDFSSLDATLDRVPHALTVSDVSEPDHPLVYMNAAFRALTGYSDSHLGENCRFLQGDLENDEARAEIRLALEEKRRTQVILNNRRKDGTQFFNLLLLEPIKNPEGSRQLVLGGQFELTPDEKQEITDNGTTVFPPSMSGAVARALELRIERRRIAATSAVQLLQSWQTLQIISDRRAGNPKT
ncbi:PAS domain-containing protein [Sulfitobacter aestuariivivens]|uniref:PAS domain-containing protein n=1 Tax=Sulfitobacter aestuariivivens TaxID=2766981 RepID=A0A927HGQ2_9RHOB|nr:PAS domain-containing protein [Sulfitobacter aestuariivivens]MBD3666236.1 PAS domain-containing protein [Sulfitobacter aestuariivivens]